MQLEPFYCLYHHHKNIYRAYKRADGAMKHLPGKARAIDADEWDRFCSGDRLVALGLRGFTCEDYHKPAQDQMVELHWAAVDIDHEHQKDSKWYAGGPIEWHPKVREICGDDAFIRFSKSGRGLHVIMKTDKPYPFKGTAAASVAAKALIAPLVKKLNDGGIMTCVAGSPNLWVWSEGGYQDWWERTKKTHPVPTVAPTIYTSSICGDIRINGGTGLGSDIVWQLVAQNILDCSTTCYNEQGRNFLIVKRHNTINIGQVKEALKDIITIKTKSQCRPEHVNEHNGFIEIDEFSVSLFSSPDNTAPGAGWLFKIPLE